VKFIKKYQAVVFVGMMIIVFLMASMMALMLVTPMLDNTEWNTDFSTSNVDANEIVSLGDGNKIDPISYPVWESVDTVTNMSAHSPVVVLANVNRAYPLVVLMEHGVVNDTIDNVPIAVTFCMLCNSPIVYERTVEGVELKFWATGAIRHSNMVMWDDMTHSLWQQLTGEAIVGEFNGIILTPIPSQVVGFSTFKERYPQGVVLVGDERLSERSYGRNPYIGYDTNPQPFFLPSDLDPRLSPTDRVLAGVIREQPIAYPFTVLSQVHVLNDTVNQVPIVAFWLEGAKSVQDNISVDQSREVGMAMLFGRTVNGRELTFRYEDGAFLDDQTNSGWNIFGEAVSGELEGMMLIQYPVAPYFWFAWSANYPDTLLWSAP
jgi:hypothetical protein